MIDVGTRGVTSQSIVTGASLRQSAEWEALRRQIYARAMCFGKDLTFDFRLLLTDARSAATAGRLMWRLIEPFEPEVLVGPGFGAPPLLYSIAAAALEDGVALSILMVRDKRKDHNQKKWVEGFKQPAGTRAVIIDDFLDRGTAVPLVERALKADGHDLDVRAVATFYDTWAPLGSRQISTSRFPVVSLFKRHDIGLSRDCFDARPPLMKGSYPEFLRERLWWRLDLNEKLEQPLKCAPVIAAGAVFAADDRCRVWRHDALTGAIEWRYDSNADAQKGIVQLLQYAEGSLVFGCYDGTVTRLDAASGMVVWRWRYGSHVHATPMLDLLRNRLFINTELWSAESPYGHLYALDWSTGRTLWSYRHAYWPPGSPVFDADTSAVIATCNDQTIVCIDADSGEHRWRAPSKGLVRGKPCVAQKCVYVATENGWLQCLEIESGNEKWAVRYGKGAMHHFPLVSGSSILVLDGKWHLTAFDAASGAIRWLTRLRSPGNWCPVACGQYLVVLSTDGHLAVLDPAKERKVWEGAIKGRYRQPPAVSDGVFAAASNNAGLLAYRIDPFYTQETSIV